MLEVIIWPPVLIPLAVSVVICFCAGALSPKIWIGLFLAELFSILSFGFIYVVGGSLLNDALSVSNFLARFFFSLQHALALAFFTAPVLAGHLVRRFLIAKSGQGQPST
jgi:hypothetical protein